METNEVRLDQWLFAARLFRTRKLAKAAIEGGKVKSDNMRVKCAKIVAEGQSYTINKGSISLCIRVCKIVSVRKKSALSQDIYQETAESIAKRETEKQIRSQLRQNQAPETKPNKTQRKKLIQMKKHQ